MTQGEMYIYYKGQMIKYRKYFSDKQRKSQLEIWKKECGEKKFSLCVIGYIPETDDLRVAQDGTNMAKREKQKKKPEKHWVRKKSPFKKGNILDYGSEVKMTISNKKPAASQTENWGSFMPRGIR